MPNGQDELALIEAELNKRLQDPNKQIEVIESELRTRGAIPENQLEAVNAGLSFPLSGEAKQRAIEAIDKSIEARELERQAREEQIAALPLNERLRYESAQELASEIGPLRSFAIGAGRGMYNIGRGLGMAEKPGMAEEAAIGALEEQRPITQIGGQMIGEAAPFVPFGVAAGGIPSLAGRAITSGVLGGIEAGILSGAENGELLKQTGIGAAIGGGTEIFFPVIGRLGRKIFKRVKGFEPKGAMLDALGRPTAELQEALTEAGISFDDLGQDAINVLRESKIGTDPTQAARQALFAEEGIPLTRGELTQDFSQQATEQRLIGAAETPLASPIREFKLNQSQKIKQSLEDITGLSPTEEETGALIQDALLGRKELLRSTKNDLYRQASEKADMIGGVPIFTDNIKESVPDKRTLRRLSRLQGNQIEALEDLLVEFGIYDDPTAIEAFIKAGGEVEPLNVQNFEEFRAALNTIERSDQTGTTSVAIGPIRRALDEELIDFSGSLEEAGKNLPEDLLSTLKSARENVVQLKQEFSPQSIIGRITDVKKDGISQVTASSKVFNRITSKATPVEDVRKLTDSLTKAGGKGEEALAALQATTLMDLVGAAFGTESRKIDGIKVFNPIAFKKRLKNIGQDKIEAVFSDNKSVIRKLKNIDKIAEDLTPPAGAVPKGSAPMILDALEKLGLLTIAGKIPGGLFLIEGPRIAAKAAKEGADVRRALDARPELIQYRNMIERIMPSLASSLGIVGAIQYQEDNDT